METLFISYSHEDSEFAEAVRGFFRISDYGTFMDQDIGPGHSWRKEIDEQVSKVQAVILILSPASNASPYVMYEWAFALGAGKPVIPLLIHHTENLHPRLHTMQHLDFTDPRRRRWDLLMEAARTAIEGDARKALSPSPDDSLKVSMKEAVEAIKLFADNKVFQRNTSLRHIVMRAINEDVRELKAAAVGDELSFPATQYTHYLISLQRDLSARVKAIALVGQEETFWQTKDGREIMQTAHRDSSRIFVFTDGHHFDQHFETLVAHAKKYHVYAMSVETLNRKFEAYSEDFSTIEATDADGKICALVAKYDRTSPLQTKIRFSADMEEIARHNEVLDSMSLQAVQIPSLGSESLNNAEVERLRARIFRDAVTTEMSEYISIDDYDQYEEKHAYYQEMMQHMIDCYRERRGSAADMCSVLELGAGTGIFTCRLAAEPATSCVALELDWACFEKLESNIRLLKRSLSHDLPVRILDVDSCVYAPEPAGQFRFIFSSFADHHIKPAERVKYLTNVKRNLAPDGWFIVGDEFLPAHDASDKRARYIALERYHNHIIEIAHRRAAEALTRLGRRTVHVDRVKLESEASAHLQLAKLERAALNSGLNSIGDFKASCEQYEADLAAAGFAFERRKIGPTDRDDLGGVYVYVANVVH